VGDVFSNFAIQDFVLMSVLRWTDSNRS